MESIENKGRGSFVNSSISRIASREGETGHFLEVCYALVCKAIARNGGIGGVDSLLWVAGLKASFTPPLECGWRTWDALRASTPQGLKPGLEGGGESRH